MRAEGASPGAARAYEICMSASAKHSHNRVRTYRNVIEVSVRSGNDRLSSDERMLEIAVSRHLPLASSAFLHERQRVQQIRRHMVKKTRRLGEQHPARLIVHIDGVGQKQMPLGSGD